uniref:Lectin, mannose binding 1 like n=1 Tax=Catagonus wagneri TaxID=51154 RepID=A0A8C3W2A3_9CETA
MLVVQGLDPLLCLLLLLFLDPHSPEGGHPPQRRFEYKLSFKGPRLALPGAGIPFWSHHGDAIPGLEEVRLAPSMRNRSGAVWSRTPVLFSAWEVEMQMRVTGLGRLGAQGMAVWYTRNRGQVSADLGALAVGDGIGILFDSTAEDTQNSPAIRVLAGNEHTEPPQPGTTPLSPPSFNAMVPGQRVSLNSGLTPRDPDEVCVDVGPLLLAPGGFFGVLAATSTLADDHDVLSFLTFSLSEPGPEPPLQPFLEMEQLRLARQLEGLRARLALGTEEDTIPKPNSKVQEEGERIFDLEETLDRHSQILQALQGLSKQLAQAERQWKKLLGSAGWARSEGAWVSGPCGIRSSAHRPGDRLAFLQDSAKVSALLRGQLTLLKDLHQMRDVAAHMASRAQVFYLPVGTKHHFSELAQILSLLQKDLRGPVKAAAKDPRPPGRSPGISSCLRPGIFLFFLLIQTVGFFCYVHFRWQELHKNLQDYLSTGSLPLSPAPQISRGLGALRRQPLSPNIQA